MEGDRWALGSGPWPRAELVADALGATLHRPLPARPLGSPQVQTLLRTQTPPLLPPGGGASGGPR